MIADLARTLLTKDQIARRVAELGRQISEDLEREQRSAQTPPQIVIIPILTGALVFAADLVRCMPIKLSLRVVAISSYPGKSMESKGVKLASEIPTDLAGKTVLVIDDILDSGQTLAVVRELIERQSPASLRLCTLLRKPDTVRKQFVPVEYVGFDIPDAFVVGYGLDYDGYYRNHPEIAVLRPEAL